MSRVIVHVQTGHDQEPMLALTEHGDIASILDAMVSKEDGDSGTLETFIEDGSADDRAGAVLYYLGLEDEAQTLASYDGTSTYINPSGTEVLVMIRPVPQDGEIVGLWVNDEGTEKVEA